MTYDCGKKAATGNMKSALKYEKYRKKEKYQSDYREIMILLLNDNFSRMTVNRLVNERQAVSPDVALRLAKLLGNSPDFWLNLMKQECTWKVPILGHLWKRVHNPVQRYIPPCRRVRCEIVYCA